MKVVFGILSHQKHQDNIEDVFIEISRETKWLICGAYHPSSQNDDYYIHELRKLLIHTSYLR